MKTIISSEQDVEEFKLPLGEGTSIIYFKLVGVGPNTLESADYLGSNICKIVRDQDGYFIIGKGHLREAMHDIVDRFCDLQEE